MICQNYFDPIVGPQLKMLQLDEKYVGFAFGIEGTMYAVGAYVAGCLLERLHKNQVVCIGSFLMSVALLIVGPSYLLGYMPNVSLMLVGIGSVGFCSAFMIVPSIPTMIEALEQEEINKDPMFSGNSDI